LFASQAGGASSNGSKWRRILDYIRVQFRLIVKLRNFDALFVRSHPAALPASLLARLWGVPVYQEINGIDADLWISYPRLAVLKPLISGLYRSQYRYSEHLFCVTDGLALWARDFAGHDRVSIVPNGANTRVFRPDGPKHEAACPYLLFVGGLVRWHGIATMIEATRDPHWPKGTELWLVGDGIERKQVEAALGTAPIRWIPSVPYEQVPDYLRGAIGAICMIEDPQGRSAHGVAPLKLFEAMASGAPVIASDLPFQADIVRDVDCGIVVAPGDKTGLAKAAAMLAGDDAMRCGLGTRGADYVRSTASWQERARAIHDVVCSRMTATSA
jgi:glycosyltransferase involved in cell wall biosynthesis